MPFKTFTGDINKVTTTSYRKLQFDGIIAFEDLSGCRGNTYLVQKGVVKSKLKNTVSGQVGERCGNCYITQPVYMQVATYSGGSTEQVVGYGTPYESCEPCLDLGSTSTSTTTSYSTTTTGSTDATYGSYLAPPIITQLCSISVAAGFSNNPVDRNLPTYSGNGCLPNQRIFILSGFYTDMMVQGTGVNMPFLSITVSGLDNLYTANSINILATDISRAYLAARQQFIIDNMNVNPANQSTQVFADLWMSKFNDGHRGTHCLDIDPQGAQNPTQPPVAVTLLDSNSPNCR